ncbi:nuclear receptor coactivator 5 isoform X1 [Diorhabda carinulata]|uniref:nuclear receptor coactivator 5 isoform X1 n=1 Tax=Diorhabda carinulata TaxID=1163345 RepID=UPI0025A19CA3|nr:nuclear receptor coactivator 5 isoform X1 [Diorhabda carinulata]
MYRTDKQFMKNPATVPCRIYIGGLAKTVIASDLEEIFKQHGTIAGLSLHSGFAFIQFEKESEAQSAIQKENGTLVCGRRITVKQALDKPKTNQNQQQKGGILNKNTQATPQKQAQESPVPQETPPPPPPQNVNVKPEFEQDTGEDVVEDDRPNIKPPGQRRHSADKGFHKGGRKGGGRNKSKDREFERFNKRFEPPPKMDVYRDNRDPYPFGRDVDYLPHRNESYQPVFEPPPPIVEKNDCEIIVVAKQLTEYAEFIEQKLKTHGMLVDLLFPNEDVPIGKVLANISSRGCLYAILVMPVNEEHRSLTLNILHGIPQEHRNMPIDDAMILISRDFEAYMKGDRVPVDPNHMTLNDRHPAQMQMLLSLLSENRQITSIQYDKLIVYLQERRALQKEYEIEQGLTPTEEPDAKQAELQNRIMNILNKSGDVSIPERQQSDESTPILKDPTVQKALDSLMLGDMFKNISG